MSGQIRRAFKWAELPPREDIAVWEGTTRWGNHDLYPIPKKERNYGTLGYFSYFIISGVSISGFTTASSYVTAGLGSWDTIAAIIVGSLFAGAVSWAGGQPGVDKRLGFTMMTRVTFGLWGKIFPLAAPLIGNIIFVCDLSISQTKKKAKFTNISVA
jgi:NCS1 family nucleobase:cation symporter-1